MSDYQLREVKQRITDNAKRYQLEQQAVTALRGSLNRIMNEGLLSLTLINNADAGCLIFEFIGKRYSFRHAFNPHVPFSRLYVVEVDEENVSVGPALVNRTIDADLAMGKLGGTPYTQLKTEESADRFFWECLNEILTSFPKPEVSDAQD
jgi:hypothetical protein